MYTSVNKPKIFFLILTEASQDGCFLICVDFSLKNIYERRNLFYIAIDALPYHDFLMQILSLYKRKVSLERRC